MSRQRAMIFCGWMAALPLLAGCVGGVGGPMQAYAPPPPAPAIPTDASGVYGIGPSQPAAILVFLPGPGEALTGNPELWTAQGFDVLNPSPAEIEQIAGNEEAAMARLISQARAMANAPVWLVGPSPAIEAALAGAGPASQVSGVVVTSAGRGTGTCSESFSYFDPGTGAPPKVTYKNSGDACPAGPMSPGALSGPAFGAGGGPAVPPPPGPEVTPHGPRIIEAALPSEKLSPPARKIYVEQLAELIRQAPAG